MKHKHFTFVLALLMSLVARAVWAYDAEIDGLYYEFDSQDSQNLFAMVVSGENAESIVIPETVTYNGKSYRVADIKSYAFSACTELTSITIPRSVTRIGYYAFENCDKIAAVHITDLTAWCGIIFDIYTTEEHADWHDEYGHQFLDWTEYWYESVSNPLSDKCHLYLNGKEIIDLVIPENVTSIGGYAFIGYAALSTVTIPNSVTSIGSAAFRDCSGLTSVTIPNSVSSIGNFAFRGCSSLTSVTIPEGVNNIGESAFRFTQLTSLTLPNSVSKIGASAFANCSLTSVAIPAGVSSIGEGAFSGCPELTSVTINSNGVASKSFLKIIPHTYDVYLEKPSAFDPRGQAMLTLTGKI